MKNIVDADTLLLWIKQRENAIKESVSKRVNKKTGKPMQFSDSTTPRDWAKFQELQAVKKEIERTKKENPSERFSKLGRETRIKNLEP